MFKLMSGLVGGMGSSESRKAGWAPEREWGRVDSLKAIGFLVLTVVVLTVAVLL